MTKKDMVKTIAERELTLWNESNDADREFGVMSMQAKLARREWFPVYKLACDLDIELLH